VQLQSRNLRWRLPGGGWHGCSSIRYQIRSSDPRPLIELEVAAVLGANRHGRTDERLGYRNGSRPRLLNTQVGDIPLSIPKRRAGRFFPPSLEPRRPV
jgi:hypothetical protein